MFTVCKKVFNANFLYVVGLKFRLYQGLVYPGVEECESHILFTGWKQVMWFKKGSNCVMIRNSFEY